MTELWKCSPEGGHVGTIANDSSGQLAATSASHARDDAADGELALRHARTPLRLACPAGPGGDRAARERVQQ